jgi:hypothetical protein
MNNSNELSTEQCDAQKLVIGRDPKCIESGSIVVENFSLLYRAVSGKRGAATYNLK